MTNIPKVSVCLPTYNRSGYLSQTLASVLAQTFTDFEVIVSDNCSTDSTPDVVGARKDPRIRYVRNERNIGLFPNMNQCLELARGEYVCILHDDDVYAPRFLEREVGMLDRHPSAGFVHCATYEIDASGVRRRLVRAYPDDCLRSRQEEFTRYLGGHNVNCSTVMGRRDLYRQTGGFDPAYLCADFLMWLRLSLKADVAYVAEPLAAIRVHGEALSSTMKPAQWCRDYLDILDRIVALAESVEPSLLRSKDRLLDRAIRAQGKRFLIASVSAMSKRESGLAERFVDVLRHLESRGLPRIYRLLARSMNNRPGRILLGAARKAMVMKASQSLPAETPWWVGHAPMPRASRVV
jgi:glycosyltransferase involved in cell wall biosynthesis